MADTTRPAPPRAASRPASRHWRKAFLAKLGETSNVAAAARAARVSLSRVYKQRREDAAFAGEWYGALAEGYDNLEMELLQHLRGGETAKSAAKRKFDTATAFRCLAAHRDSVAREKGRRTLAEEVATIAAINAKIDRLRLNAGAADKAIKAARRGVRTRARSQGAGLAEGGAEAGPAPSSGSEAAGPAPSSSSEAAGPAPSSSSEAVGPAPSSSSEAVGPARSSSSEAAGPASSSSSEAVGQNRNA